MSTSGKPLRKDAERNRQRILASAREVFAQRGLSATLDDVAEHAGVGVGTVYRRFPDKDALIDVVLEEGIDEVVAIAEEGMAMEDAWEGLVHFLREGLALQAANRGLREIIFSSERGEQRTRLARERIAPRVIEMATRAQAAGQLRADIAPTDFPLMQFTMGHLADFTAEHPDLWRRMHTVLIDGLRADPDGTTPMPVAPIAFEQLDGVMTGYRPPRR